jgi:hypothetical protein
MIGLTSLENSLVQPKGISDHRRSMIGDQKMLVKGFMHQSKSLIANG